MFAGVFPEQTYQIVDSFKRRAAWSAIPPHKNTVVSLPTKQQLFLNRPVFINCCSVLRSLAAASVPGTDHEVFMFLLRQPNPEAPGVRRDLGDNQGTQHLPSLKCT